MAVARPPRWGFAALAVLALALGGWAVLAPKSSHKGQGLPPVPVAVAQVAYRDTPVSIDAIGAAQAWRGVVIRAQVNGKLLSVGFKEGSQVRAGQVLAEIDPAPYRAQLLQAEGALKRDQALLTAARLDLARYQQLTAQDSIAARQVDAQLAQVKQYEGLVEIDQGQVNAARINLGYCRITSPIAGRMGVRLVDQGNLVSATDTGGIATVNEISPIAVVFTVPQGDFQRVMDASGQFRRPMAVQALSQETGQLLAVGEISIADNHVDSASGSVQLKAKFDNSDHRLWPGQLLDVRLTLQTLAHALTVPATAITQGPNGPFVYVVGSGGKAQARPVKLGPVEQGAAVVESGLSAGDIVVTDGQMSLAPGARVLVHGAAAGKHSRG
jgi:multidrug efflux system membrane fusion protein